ncbi:hypothetical protein LOTGIDRAFT_155003 [Lottia gigantea]|uniref:Uncharacterized protein n=1 Tax=Lottia gigantea TaxID=225164 RepID=V3ZX36_LOTGI|nr:hypothetical protein LOTGIDRAFT_155003 [Lottia gigantea]ESO85516.1 hypothetical protein LOTGIDRAFT_155003 [Lottia gigantea]
MSMIIAQTPKTYFGSDIQKSLGSLPGFPWAKYPGEKHLPGDYYTGPGTRLDLRLDQNVKPKPGEEPVNRVDASAPKHVSDWIPDVGDGRVLIEPVRNVPNDAVEARMRAIARNTIERVERAGNHGFEKRVLQYNNVVENNRWGNYVNWKLYPLFGLLEHRKVSVGLPYKMHLQRS